MSTKFLKTVFVTILFTQFQNSFSQNKYSLDSKNIAKGKEIFEVQCAACHSFTQNGIGPELSQTLKKRDKNWLISYLKNPQKTMAAEPNFDKRVIQQREVIASCERNNFMLLVPPNTFYMDYWIGDNAVHNFNFGPRCTFCHRRRRYGRYKTRSSSFFSSASSPAPSDTSSSSYSEDSFDDYGCN